MGYGREEAGAAPSLLPRCFPEQTAEAPGEAFVPGFPARRQVSGARLLRPVSAGARRLNRVGQCSSPVSRYLWGKCLLLLSGSLATLFSSLMEMKARKLSSG